MASSVEPRGGLAVKAKWVVAEADEQPQLLSDTYVIIEEGRIVGFGPRPPSGATVLEPAAGLVVPGFINLHAHSLNAPLFRGLVDDLPSSDRPEDMIYQLLMPVGQLAVDLLDDRELSALIASGLTEMMLSGTTTVVDMWRPGQQSAFFAVAESLGIRVYGAPYIRSRAILGLTDAGHPRYGPEEGEESLEAALQIYRRYDEGLHGRMRVALGPHGMDTCSAALLARIADAADRLDVPVTAHVAQSRTEVDVVARRDGMTPLGLLERAGLARAGTIAAHCTFAHDMDLARLATSGMTVAHCPMTYARLGVSVTVDRFSKFGMPVALGTDAYCMDMLAEMRAAGFLSKLQTGRSDAVTAWSLLDVVTRVAADALRRPDLGRIAPGKTADLAVFDLQGVHVEPVIDPVKTLVWYGTQQNLYAVIVDGRVTHTPLDPRRGDAERSAVCRSAVQRVVDAARDQRMILS